MVEDVTNTIAKSTEIVGDGVVTTVDRVVQIINKIVGIVLGIVSIIHGIVGITFRSVGVTYDVVDNVGQLLEQKTSPRDRKNSKEAKPLEWTPETRLRRDTM